MSRKIVFEEKNGTQMVGGGRKVTWLMKSSKKDSQYTSVLTLEIEPSSRVKPAHSHPNAEEVVYIISGTGKVLVGDQVSAYGPGSLIYFPQNVPHMMWNNGNELVRGVCVYAPSDEEIIYEYHDDIDFPEFK